MWQAKHEARREWRACIFEMPFILCIWALAPFSVSGSEIGDEVFSLFSLEQGGTICQLISYLVMETIDHWLGNWLQRKYSYLNTRESQFSGRSCTFDSWINGCKCGQKILPETVLAYFHQCFWKNLCNLLWWLLWVCCSIWTLGMTVTYMVNHQEVSRCIDGLHVTLLPSMQIWCSAEHTLGGGVSQYEMTFYQLVISWRRLNA